MLGNSSLSPSKLTKEGNKQGDGHIYHHAVE